MRQLPFWLRNRLRAVAVSVYDGGGGKGTCRGTVFALTL